MKIIQPFGLPYHTVRMPTVLFLNPLRRLGCERAARDQSGFSLQPLHISDSRILKLVSLHYIIRTSDHGKHLYIILFLKMKVYVGAFSVSFLEDCVLYFLDCCFISSNFKLIKTLI